MRFLITNTQDFASPFSQEELRKHEIGKWNLFSTDSHVPYNSSEFGGVVDGYVRDFDIDKDNMTAQNRSVFQHLWNSWPLSLNITGSFAATLINKNSSELVLCNDLIGVYPLYYLRQEKNLFISNSLIWLGIISPCERDEAGIAQRCFGPEFCNLGRRTILKDCKRLLPGEWLKFDENATEIDRKYDNSLYQSIEREINEDTLTLNYWSTLKKELQYCLVSEPRINLALSGGMDSRILLGAVSLEKSLSCYTYGKDENYETKIAQRLAQKKGADFKSFSDPWLNFPKKELLRNYTLNTEAAYLSSWFEILEHVDIKKKEVLLLGDLSTSVSGRTIKRFSTKAYREKNYFKHSVLGKGYDLTINNPQTFENWKQEILQKFLRPYNKSSLEMLDLKISVEKIRQNIIADINELFARIEAHNIKYIDLVDELFTWYTHTRFPMGKQILVNNSRFRAYCPGLSMAVIREASNIPPEFRLNQKFVRKLFQEQKELRVLSKIPTSQIPLIPQYFPDIVRFPVWAIRSKLDDFFIRRMMKAKDPGMRYRLFLSNNWVNVYQNPDLETNLDAYFEYNHLGKAYVKGIKSQALQRRDLKQWPFANMNIINAAALNIELELIASYRNQYEV